MLYHMSCKRVTHCVVYNKVVRVVAASDCMSLSLTNRHSWISWKARVRLAAFVMRFSYDGQSDCELCDQLISMNSTGMLISRILSCIKSPSKIAPNS